MLQIFKKEDTNLESMAYIFIGRSGCGKGTQVELFKKNLGENSSAKILHIETGSSFREFIKTDSFIAKLSKQTVESGGLMPACTAVNLWVNYLIAHYTGHENMIFDGAPRKYEEAPMLGEMLVFLGIKNYKVIHINTSREWCTARLLARGRKDDSAEGIKKRMDWYDIEVSRSINFFETDSNCECIDVNGEQTIEQVHEELIKKVFHK